jgi:hypothetical protein
MEMNLLRCRIMYPMQYLLLSIIPLLAIIFPLRVEAFENSIHVESWGNGKTIVEQNSNTGSKTVVNQSDSSNISIKQEGGGDNKVIVDNNKFEVSGKVSSISDSSFDLSGQKIYLNSSEVSRLKSNGVLTVGNQVTAKGDIKSSQLYATEVQGNAESSASSQPNPSADVNSIPPSSSPDVLGDSETNIDIKTEDGNFLVKIFNLCKGILESIF